MSGTGTPSGRSNTKFRLYVRGVTEAFFLTVQYMVEWCTGTTRRGLQCKLRPQLGQSTCRLHGGPQCPVCIEPLGDQTRTLDCQHTFHTRCLDRWKRTARTCPMCRAPFDAPQYRVRISVQRLEDSHVSTDTYTTTDISGLTRGFGINPMMSTRYMTDILFEVEFDESLDAVLGEYGFSMPSQPFVPVPVPTDPHHI